MIVANYRGTNYNVPEPSNSWTQSLTNLIVALATTAISAGIASDADFGALFGVAAIYFRSKTANPATAGVVRLAAVDSIDWRNQANSSNLALGPNVADQLSWNSVNFAKTRAVVAYSASMTFDASAADQFVITATTGVAFTINAPTNPTTGQRFTLRIRNTSGGALGVATFNAVFKLAAWAQPATANSRAIVFEYDGTNWIEALRTPADVPN